MCVFLPFGKCFFFFFRFWWRSFLLRMYGRALCYDIHTAKERSEGDTWHREEASASTFLDSFTIYLLNTYPPRHGISIHPRMRSTVQRGQRTNRRHLEEYENENICMCIRCDSFIQIAPQCQRRNLCGPLNLSIDSFGNNKYKIIILYLFLLTDTQRSECSHK